ncbi:MAG: LUD domain-containing protein [Dehalococcoidia bacterium]|jgi:L-lactate dehydrogenase complex protein LldF
MPKDNELLERFKTEAALTGAQIKVASSAEEAVEYVLGLAKEKGITTVVKSTSSIADRLDLAARLSKAGIKVMETSIAQWAAQLARGQEVPIDKLAELVSAATGEKVPAEPEAILRVARRMLKDAYTGAGLGITEADFGIAETGTLVTLENEGNARLAAALPKLHLTLLDGARIAGSLADAADLIKDSPGGIPGHKVPTFITYLTGRNTTADIPGAIFARAQGPAEEHILILIA